MPAPEGPSPLPDSPPPSDLPTLPVTFRPRRVRVVLLSIGVAVLVVFTVVAALLPSTGGAAWGPGDRLTFVGSGLLVSGVLALLARPKVVAERDTVTVVNLTVKRRLKWAQVVRVNLRSGDPWVLLDLADGTTMAAMGIQRSGGRARALQDARRLSALAEALGGGSAGH